MVKAARPGRRPGGCRNVSPVPGSGNPLTVAFAAWPLLTAQRRVHIRRFLRAVPGTGSRFRTWLVAFGGTAYSELQSGSRRHQRAWR